MTYKGRYERGAADRYAEGATVIEAMGMNDDKEVEALATLVTQLEARVLAVVGAVLGGGGLFVMTAWLLLKGGPAIGPHLQLLGQYFYGYSVTWLGSLVGLLYGALVGGAIGWMIGTIYNYAVWVRYR